MKLILFLLCTLLLLFSCKRESALPKRTIHVNSGETADTSRFSIGPYHFTVTPGSTHKSYSSSLVGGVRRVDYQRGDLSIIIIEDRLYIDYFDFGTIEQGDSILVDSISVIINGKNLKGKELSLAEAQKIATIPKTTKEMHGHSVEIIPGVSTYMQNKLKAELDVGPYRITIKNGNLFVNNSMYGKIRKGEPISIQLGRVYVSGKLRLAK